MRNGAQRLGAKGKKMGGGCKFSGYCTLFPAAHLFPLPSPPVRTIPPATTGAGGTSSKTWVNNQSTVIPPRFTTGFPVLGVYFIR